MTLPDPPLLLIAGLDKTGQPPTTQIRAALAGGCRWISFRERTLSPEQYGDILETLNPLAASYGARLSAHHDRPEQLPVPVDGVHLSRYGDVAAARRVLGIEGLIGISTHDREEALAALQAGADYVTLSPVYAPLSKMGTLPPLGLGTLEQITRQLPIPVVALGGITPVRVKECLAAGARGIAVMGAIAEAEDPTQVTVDLIENLRSSY